MGLRPSSAPHSSYAVWDTAVLVLNVLAFLIIGLELGPIIAARSRHGVTGRFAPLAIVQ
ncbi:hypothetical protein GWG65_35245 [Bradyrhizobium sp. CSA207]|nr:hypothetical protein [Bradyrhizobium sp. CSA207]